MSAGPPPPHEPRHEPPPPPPEPTPSTSWGPTPTTQPSSVPSMSWAPLETPANSAPIEVSGGGDTPGLGSLLGGALSSLGIGPSSNPVPPAPEVDDPPITNNFIVILDGLSLGRWTECSGLAIKFKTAEFQPGGGTISAQMLSQKTQQTLTLARPFASASIPALQWFESYANSTAPITATIYSCDHMGKPLYFWELSGVIPIEWNGPKFKAGEAAATSEVLKLNYMDISSYGVGDGSAGGSGGSNNALEMAGDIVSGLLGTPRLLMLGLAGLAADALMAGGLTFDIVPNTFTISSGINLSKNTGIKASEDSTKVQSLNSKPRTLAFKFVLDSLTLDANKQNNPLAMAGYAASNFVGIQPQLMFLSALTGNQLWSPSLVGSLLSAAASMLGISTDPPTAMFMWGPFSFQGAVTSLSIEITMLSKMGVPQRANVGITMTEYLSGLPFQNPTSGAAGATHTHTVVAGDSLASIAYATYGHADRWRGIAQLNGIDDPLKLRPGTTLLLPSAEDARAGK